MSRPRLVLNIFVVSAIALSSAGSVEAMPVALLQPEMLVEQGVEELSKQQLKKVTKPQGKQMYNEHVEELQRQTQKSQLVQQLRRRS